MLNVSHNVMKLSKNHLKTLKRGLTRIFPHPKPNVILITTTLKFFKITSFYWLPFCDTKSVQIHIKRILLENKASETTGKPPINKKIFYTTLR